MKNFIKIIFIASTLFIVSKAINTSDPAFVEKYSPKILQQGDNHHIPVVGNRIYFKAKAFFAKTGELFKDFTNNFPFEHKLGTYQKRYNLKEEIPDYPLCFNELIYRLSKGEKTQITCLKEESFGKEKSIHSFTGKELNNGDEIILEVELVDVHGQGRNRKYVHQHIKDEL